MISLVRPAVAGALTIAMLLPSGMSAAAQTSSTGTLVGSVTCGAEAITPAVNAVVAPEGLNLQTQTNSVGQFTLSNVPAAQSLTIDVINPEGSAETSRYNVVVQPGETLDIGSMDLVICPLVGAFPPAQDDSYQQVQEQAERGSY
ncbi:MAG TPA: hypothetical protein VGJ60_22195 [Chloroflexota bacterium]|jgi:hypothetical protein